MADDTPGVDTTTAERGLIVFAVVFLVVFTAGFLVGFHWLNNQSWFGALSNTIQLVSAPATLAAVVAFAWTRWHDRCAVPYCVRRGDHPVDGTLRKTCSPHHTRHHHGVCHDLYGEAHRLSGRLNRGESHGRTV